jgi:tetratricopeptide (TPR) repeat protein
MRFTLFVVCLSVIVFGFTKVIQAQEKLLPPATPAANNLSSKPEPSLYQKGLALLESGAYAEAAKTLRQAVEHDPNNAAAYGKLGVAYAALGQYKEAVIVLKLAIKIKPEIVDAEEYYQLSRAYGALEKFPQALDAIKQALYAKRAEQANLENGNASKFPSMADLHYATGLAYYNLRIYYAAIEELKQALALNPKHAPAYFGLALTYLANGDRKSAEKQQRPLESLDPVYAAQLAKLLATKPNDPQSFEIEP